MHVESATTNTTGRKRKKSVGNAAVYNVIITVRRTSSYSGTPLFGTSELWTPYGCFTQVQIEHVFALVASAL